MVDHQETEALCLEVKKPLNTQPRKLVLINKSSNLFVYDLSDLAIGHKVFDS